MFRLSLVRTELFTHSMEEPCLRSGNNSEVSVTLGSSSPDLRETVSGAHDFYGTVTGATPSDRYSHVLRQYL